MMKPKAFVGSSSEGLNVAYALQSELEDDGDFTVWSQGVFRPSEFTLESLVKAVETANLGIFVFSADDVVKMRGAENASVRDNVLFEFGLFVGRLGRGKSVIVQPKGEDLRFPTDLLGLTHLTYNPKRDDGNIRAALGPACNSIRTLLREIGPQFSGVPVELDLTFVERRDQLSVTQRALLTKLESRERCETSELAKRFPKMSDAELHYRLEHL